MELKTVLRGIIAAVIIFIILFSMLWIKTLSTANKYYTLAEAKFTEDNYKEAILDYSEVIRNYTPGNKKIYLAIKKMFHIAEFYEKQEKYRRSIETYREVTASLYGSESFYQPGQEWINKAETQIERLLKIIKK